METGLRVLRHAATKLGAPYRWGAIGSERFDCSGLIIWAARAAGVELEGRPTAAVLYHRLPRLKEPRPGCTCYWKNRAGRVFHVGLVDAFGSDWIDVLGAHGGGSSTVTDEIAASQGAKVQVKRYRRAGIAGYRGWMVDADDGYGERAPLMEPEQDAGQDELPEDFV